MQLLAKIDRSYDGEWMSCMSKDGKRCYVNNQLPKTVDIKGKLVDIDQVLLHHEEPEWHDIRRLIDQFKAQYGREPNVKERGRIYLKAHKQTGVTGEHAYCRKMGIDWAAWNAWCRGKEKWLETVKETNVPPDADVKPIPHDHENLQVTLEAHSPKSFRAFQEAFSLPLDYHDVLNPDLWVNDVLNPHILAGLLKIARSWEEFAKVPVESIRDVVITGGNANYNWVSGHSDIDLHVVADFKVGNLSQDRLDDRKKIWLLTRHITIKGISVEPYVQDVAEPHPSNQGVYSILHNRWVERPFHGSYNFTNDPHLAKKVEHYVTAIDHGIAENDRNGLHLIREKLKRMRSEGLAKGGEFSFANLVFKAVRNSGALDRMNRFNQDREDADLSLS